MSAFMKELKDAYDKNDDVVADWDKMSEYLYAIMVDKTDGEALRRVRRTKVEGNGVEAYCRFHIWMTEISIMGIMERQKAPMEPRTAKNDEEIADCVEKWEEEVKYLEKATTGENQVVLGEGMKIAALYKIVPRHVEESIRLRGIRRYEQVRQEIMQYAVDKRVEKNRNKLGTAMDVGEVARENNWEEYEDKGNSEERDYTQE